jgi:hypothetical protein
MKVLEVAMLADSMSATRSIYGNLGVFRFWAAHQARYTSLRARGRSGGTVNKFGYRAEGRARSTRKCWRAQERATFPKLLALADIVIAPDRQPGRRPQPFLCF